MLDVRVLIVNYNTAHLVGDAIRSVQKQRGVSYEISVVDNASRDDSRAVLEAFGTQIQLIASPENLGFGRANNLAAEGATARYLYLLNPDAQLDQPHALATLTARLDADPAIGLASPRLLNLDGSDQDPPRRTYPGQRGARADFAALPGEIAWLVGASLFIRRSTYVALGGFDPDYFLYAEETDLCLRLRRLGFSIVSLPELSVTHVDGASEAKSTPRDVWLRRLRGQHLFYRKHYAKPAVARLATRELWRARLRSFTLRFAAQKDSVSVASKIAKYEAMRAVAAETLAELALASPKLPTVQGDDAGRSAQETDP